MSLRRTRNDQVTRNGLRCNIEVITWNTYSRIIKYVKSKQNREKKWQRNLLNSFNMQDRERKGIQNVTEMFASGRFVYLHFRDARRSKRRIRLVHSAFHSMTIDRVFNSIPGRPYLLLSSAPPKIRYDLKKLATEIPNYVIETFFLQEPCSCSWWYISWNLTKKISMEFTCWFWFWDTCTPNRTCAPKNKSFLGGRGYREPFWKSSARSSWISPIRQPFPWP